MAPRTSEKRGAANGDRVSSGMVRRWWMRSSIHPDSHGPLRRYASWPDKLPMIGGSAGVPPSRAWFSATHEPGKYADSLSSGLGPQGYECSGAFSRCTRPLPGKSPGSCRAADSPAERARHTYHHRAPYPADRCLTRARDAADLKAGQPTGQPITQRRCKQQYAGACHSAQRLLVESPAAGSMRQTHASCWRRSITKPR